MAAMAAVGAVVVAGSRALGMRCVTVHQKVRRRESGERGERGCVGKCMLFDVRERVCVMCYLFDGGVHRLGHVQRLGYLQGVWARARLGGGRVIPWGGTKGDGRVTMWVAISVILCWSLMRRARRYAITIALAPEAKGGDG